MAVESSTLSPEVAELIDTIEGIRSRFDVPGVSVAVIHDGETLLCRGFGRTHHEADSSDAVDEHTLFAIASNSKLFTAVALGLLADEKKLEWDGAVVDYLPEFGMQDGWVTRQVSVRDLLAHRTGLGLGAGDLLWWPPTHYSRHDVLQRLRHVRAQHSFRSKFAYANVPYVVAGLIVERLSGQSWESFVTTRILQPLHMTSTLPCWSDTDTDVDPALLARLAQPHAHVDGRLQCVTAFRSAAMNPLGGLHSSAADMAKWATVLLRRGRLADGGRLFSIDTANEIMRIVTPMPNPSVPAVHDGATYTTTCYALGLVASNYRGNTIYYHTGGLPGYVSRLTLLPHHRTAVVVLTNAECCECFDAVTHTVIDALLLRTGQASFPPVDWATALAVSWNPAAQPTPPKRVTGTRHALPLSGYACLLSDKWFGNVLVSYSPAGGLRIECPSTPLLHGSLSHWHYDTFLVRWDARDLRADALLTFYIDGTGAILRADMKALHTSTDFSFDFHDLKLKPT